MIKTKGAGFGSLCLVRIEKPAPVFLFAYDLLADAHKVIFHVSNRHFTYGSFNRCEDRVLSLKKHSFTICLTHEILSLFCDSHNNILRAILICNFYKIKAKNNEYNEDLHLYTISNITI